MNYALTLAGRHTGLTGGNPSVGCVLVKNGVIIGSGCTAKGGRPHAENIAIRQAGAQAKGATAFVTLEPCAHIGKTPSCADLLISAGIKEVIIALSDPDPRTNGRSIIRLQQSGITVRQGLCAKRAYAVHADFLSRITNKRPLISLKIASSLDGKIALNNGQSRWITNTLSRRHAHHLRLRHNAIMVGINTIISDDPILDCRLHGINTNEQPDIIIADRTLRIPLSARLWSHIKQNNRRLIILCAKTALISSKYITHLQDAGAEIIPVFESDKDNNWQEAVAWLANKKINSILVEGGGTIWSSLWQQKLWDRLFWFKAPIIAGNDSIPAITALQATQLTQLHNQITLVSQNTIGTDICLEYHPGTSLK